MNSMIHEETTVFYVVAINGVPSSPMFNERVLAEMEKNKLPPEKRELAEVILITKQGQQLLLG